MLEGTTIGDMKGDTGNLGANPAESLFTAEVMKGPHARAPVLLSEPQILGRGSSTQTSHL